MWLAIVSLRYRGTLAERTLIDVAVLYPRRSCDVAVTIAISTRVLIQRGCGKGANELFDLLADVE